MNHHRHLSLLAAADPRLADLPTIRMGGTERDAAHAHRRCQQRAISLTKLRIALAYGRIDHHHGLKRWTLLGRQLSSSPYARFQRELEGLQLVGALNPEQGLVQIKTCKWVWAMRRH